MKKAVYIFSSGTLKRKDNNIVFEPLQETQSSSKKKYLTVEILDAIYIFGEIKLNTRLLSFLSQKKIPLHVFNRYGFYTGSYMPRNAQNSGYITLKQAEHYLDRAKRVELAQAFVLGALTNEKTNLLYYARRFNLPKVKEAAETIKEIAASVRETYDINNLLQKEGLAKEFYYRSWDYFLKEDFPFESRSRKPPLNPLNALISFGNSLLYTTVLSEIYRTYLDPRIGYLHFTNQRSYTLNLDIADIFKPVIVDRVIFTLINKNELSLSDFEPLGEGVILSQKGRKKFIQAYEEKLKTTVVRGKGKKYSYRRLIRLECYKLYRHLFGEKKYRPFLSWW